MYRIYKLDFDIFEICPWGLWWYIEKKNELECSLVLVIILKKSLHPWRYFNSVICCYKS